MLLLTFSSGEKRIFDATQLTGPAYEPLKDIKIFENFKSVSYTHLDVYKRQE